MRNCKEIRILAEYIFGSFMYNFETTQLFNAQIQTEKIFTIRQKCISDAVLILFYSF